MLVLYRCLKKPKHNVQKCNESEDANVGDSNKSQQEGVSGDKPKSRGL